MKRIGIISLYHNNYNYGGLLQAFALQRVIENLGNEALQISFDSSSSTNYLLHTRKEKIENILEHNVARYLLSKIRDRMRCLYTYRKNDVIARNLSVRNERLKQFELSIPHSNVLNSATIEECTRDFDTLVAGSDQIWNPEYTRDEYFLSFARGQRKISYAASIGRDVLSGREKDYFIEKLKTFDAISVREKKASEMLANIGLVNELVLDPTLLLSKQQWDDAIYEYVINEPYLLVYFLGNSLEHRKAVRDFAKKRGVKIVTFPHILGDYEKADEGFGDYQLYDVSPTQFVYLIKNARYIITDSFHACVFSLIYEKQFWVFDRTFGSQKRKMNSRIESLLNIANQSERFINPKKLSAVSDCEYKTEELFKNLRIKSLEFLQDNL